MGQLRNALRAYAVLEHGPSATLRSLSELLAALEPDAFATAFYAELEPSTGEVVWANAGHPPPLVIPHAGEPHYLRVAGSPPLGLVGGLFDVAGGGGKLVLGPGDGIFMYTDGLIERRQSDITDGLDRLRLLAGVPGGASTDAIVLGMREETGFADDVCALLAVRPL
jgi:serine phosphatase RsbU (regulator of sigma subunit)